VPTYHFIQVPACPEQNHLRYLLRFLVENDEMVQRGFEAINQMLYVKNIDGYCYELIVEIVEI